MTGEKTGRPTPYDVAFGGTELDTEGFDAIAREADAAGALNDPARFMMSQTVGGLLRDYMNEAPSPNVAAFGPLLYHAYQYRLFGRKVLRVDEALLRELLADGAPIGDWDMVPPAPAGYLQLPRNLVWSRIVEDAHAEPVDGIFWAMAGRDDPATPPFPRLDALVILGMLPGRPGFSAIRVSSELPAESQGHWGDITSRADGRDFDNVLPGGEYQQLFALVTHGEVLKLISRVFRYAAAHPERVHLGTSDG